MKSGLLIFYLILSSGTVVAQMPAVSAGTVNRLEQFPSRFIEARNIDVWLPAGYSTRKKYAVLYMHDGQMLFDAATTWNKTAWDVDDALTKLLNERKIRDVIVVGVWNTSSRHAEYFPQQPFESLGAAQQEAIYEAARENGYSVFNGQTIMSDNYLKFLVQELKPAIDARYSTYSDQRNTFVAGSSMGGLISMYALCEYPDVFGGAACLSTHWPGVFTMEGNPVPQAFLDYLANNLPDPKNHRIYFDCGDQTLDALYPPLQMKVDSVMRAKGYTKRNWVTRYFPGEDHTESAWKKRLDIPVLFLLKK